MVIPDPFSRKTVNNFNSSPPFGLFNIFNHLIYHSTDYDKQGLAAYKSFDDYRLFNDGYVESLLSAPLKHEGVHVYIAKVKPFMKLKTDEGKEYSKHDVSVKMVEIGVVSILQLPCMLLRIC